MRRICLGLMITILAIFILSVMPACANETASEDISGAFANKLAAISKSTLDSVNSQVAQLDSQLNEVETKLGKLDHVAQPALEWIELTKAKAESENWGGDRIVRVGKELNQMQNDQYQVVKLEMRTTMTSGGRKSEGTIEIQDLITGQTTPYEELYDSLQKQVNTLKAQRQSLLQNWDLVKATGSSVIEQAPNWTVKKIDKISYQIAGEALGWWSNELTRGEWVYNTESGKPTPSGSAADALYKLLSGK